MNAKRIRSTVDLTATIALAAQHLSLKSELHRTHTQRAYSFVVTSTAQLSVYDVAGHELWPARTVSDDQLRALAQDAATLHQGRGTAHPVAAAPLVREFHILNVNSDNRMGVGYTGRTFSATRRFLDAPSSGTHLTNTEYLKAAERIASVLVHNGFTLRQAAVLLGTVYSYTLSLTQEEQAAYPRPDERSTLYDLETRNARLDPETLPLMIAAGPVLLDAFDRRYREGLSLILDGAARQLAGNTAAPYS